MRKTTGKILLILLMLFFISSTSFATSWDIENHWAKTDIVYLIEKGIIQGYSDGTFRPNKSISRAEFLTIVNKVFGYTEKVEISFSDVKKHDWFYDDIKKAVSVGYIGGYEDGTMKPNRFITREEASKIIAVVCGLEDDVSNSAHSFNDANQIGEWAGNYIGILKDKGYMSGYEDGTFRPKRQITRGEAAKILANVSRNIIEIPEEKPKNEWYCVQAGVYSSGELALEQASILRGAGFEDAFIIRDQNNYKYCTMVGKFSTQEEAEILKEKAVSKGFDAFVTIKTFEESSIIKLKEPIKEVSKDEEFIKLVEELPNPNEIIEIVANDKVKTEKARKMYNDLTDKEKANVSEEVIRKLSGVEAKIQSLKTPIRSRTKSTVAQGQAWAINKGAHKRFVDIAPLYWEYGERTGINPEILYLQAAKETNFGRYTGAVKPEMNNWAGIKTFDAAGDRTEDHETFATPEDGVRAHFNHMGIYCGVDPIGEPHPRWYKTSTVGWRGTVQYVEDLGGRWAPSLDYGISITRDYLKHLYKTPVPSEEDMNRAIEVSNKIDELSDVLLEEDVLKVIEAIDKYDSLTEWQKALVPYNIKDKADHLRRKQIFEENCILNNVNY